MAEEVREECSQDMSLVAARTDGIRGKRYIDYQIPESGLESGLESGELSDSSSDIIVVDSETDTSSKPIVKEKTVSLKRPLTPTAVESSHDIYDIQSIIKSVEPSHDQSSWSGVSQLLMSHRESTVTVDLSSDEDSIDSLSPSSDDSDLPVACAGSMVGDVGMAALNIKDHHNRELFPQVEIVDLTLGVSEEILPLGKVVHIVDDFVVIKCDSPNRILDLDSMVFDGNKRCVGYIFEVLGPVKDPYYSMHFNTNSDIQTLGLDIGQELFFSLNANYSRYLMVELLRELEYSRKQDDSCASDSSEDSVDNVPSKRKIIKAVPSKKTGSSKKPVSSKKVHNRTTHNYSIDYINRNAAGRSTDYINKNAAGRSTDSFAAALTQYSRDFVEDNKNANNSRNSESYKNSVLASFMDPFSLEPK